MLRSAVPILASVDIAQSVAFYESELGFTRVHEEPTYGIVIRDDVQIHFWKCSDPAIAEQTACRVRVDGVRELYDLWKDRSFIHPNAKLEAKPWGTVEFGVVDCAGNLITFTEIAK